MRKIRTQQEARPAQSLDFCYLCGEVFAAEPERNNAPDHLPPRAVFDRADRNWPLVVACHYCCNQERSMTDQKIGQLISVTRGQYPAERDIALNIRPWPVGEGQNPIGVLSELNFQAEVWRWVRGFHASLYGEYLPGDGEHRTYPPMPVGEMTLDGPRWNEDHLPIQAGVVQQIRLNRAIDRLDEIQCNNGKVRYVCLWAPPTPEREQRWECWFGLKVYEWQTLGDPRFPRRACIGRYSIAGKPPVDASIAVTIDFPVRDGSPLDPFEP
jgi:hypothetical protein